MWTVHLVLSKNTSFHVLLELMYLNILSSASVASSTSSLGEPFGFHDSLVQVRTEFFGDFSQITPQDEDGLLVIQGLV
ncbi:hypothetical protein BDR26DRAFT_859999, partial [Obelidium mucronatum]